ncbi:hypothetical protein HW132_03165 [Brasilonema sp. CT11]|nr:hypothetical protein [Brasilonema sp. CT11]
MSLDCIGGAVTAMVQAFCLITQTVGSGGYQKLAQSVSEFEQRLQAITAKQ